MNPKKLTIRISLFLDDTEIGHREASGWEEAEENLDRLERWFEKKQSETEAIALGNVF